jgi:hypothetical protein
MIITENKKIVTMQMLKQNNLFKNDLIGVPIDPKNINIGVNWKHILKMNKKDFNNLEKYFIINCK